jgi:5,10-methylenetetrahydromethanopterin reductase
VAVRQGIETIRAMLGAREITLDGPLVRVVRGRLDFTPVRPAVPVYIGARGPALLRLAGEVADGVIVGGVASVEGWRYALGEVHAGATRAGRALDALQVVAWLYTSIADDPRRALDAIRPMVATSLATSRPVLHRFGVELPAGYAKAMESRGWSLATDVVREAAREVPAETALRFGIAGTDEDCAVRLSALLTAVPEITQVSVLPFPPAGETRRSVLRRFMERVVPRVQG